MPAIRGKDYGKTKMRYPDYTETESGLQYKVTYWDGHLLNLHSDDLIARLCSNHVVTPNYKKSAGLASRKWPHTKGWRYSSGKLKIFVYMGSNYELIS